MAGLVLKHISKTYPGMEKKKSKKEKEGAHTGKDVQAVGDFNLEIMDKEFLVLVGPSGCGKSTMLRMIAGLEEITGGELYIDGKLVNDVAAKDRDIAMVFQSYALYPHMTVYENMAFSLKLRKVPREEIRERVLETARILELDEYLDRRPKALSGGQRQRVALGRAIVRKPKVFLMDEPLSNLDAKLRVAMRTEIEKLHTRLATTFVYVTHDQTEAMTMGDRIVVMKDGVIQQCGTPVELYQKPANRFVAEFIGSPQMNLFSAVLKKTDNGFFAGVGDWDIKIDPHGSIKALEGGGVAVGIRPEDFTVLDKTSGANDTAVDAVIDVKEMLGSDIYLYLDIPGIPGMVTARMPASFEGKAGDSIRIAVDGRKLHMFHPETGIRLA